MCKESGLRLSYLNKKMGRSRYKLFEDEYPYLLTSSFVRGLPLFSIPEVADSVLGAIRYHQSKNNLEVYAWCFMENHFHLIARHRNLKLCIQSIKSYSAKQILNLLESRRNRFYMQQMTVLKDDKTRYQVWQKGFHPKQIFAEKVLHQKIDYIHYNPVQRGYVEKAEYWRYSSAKDYEGSSGLLDIQKLL